MKALFRSRAVQAILTAVFAAYLKLCLSSKRWIRVNQDAAEATWAEGGPIILCFWHARISYSPWSWDRRRAPEIAALISHSRDGEFIANTMAKLGFPAIRGSSTKSTIKGEKEKGGAAAFRDALRWMRGGGSIAITPDGPRGPAERMQEGAPMLAKMTGAPVLFVGLASDRQVRLDTWDRGTLPLPFGKAAMVWDGPVRVERDADIEALKDEWSARLTAVTERAEALVA
jgi:lysophospholipid acyltransferase (LPLAT)-like uncharacterized protein